MAAIKNLNPKAEIAKSHQALAINIGAARGLRDVMKTNLGKLNLMSKFEIFLTGNIVQNCRVQSSL